MTASAPRQVVVTGGAGGIGRAIATRFAQGGCEVYLLGRDEGKLAAAAREMAAATGQTITPLRCDLGDPASIAQALGAAKRIDVLVNAAGSIARKPLLD